jgi:hypothetical protein
MFAGVEVSGEAGEFVLDFATFHPDSGEKKIGAVF